MEPLPAPDSDEELTAYLDGELGSNARDALDRRLASEPALRARLAALETGRPPSEPFDILLDAAPVERLEAMLAATTTPTPSRPARSPRGVFLQAIAAAIALVVLGGAIGFLLARSVTPVNVAEVPNWRAVVADYVALYTPDTFALAPSDPEAYAARLKALGDGLGLALAPDTVALPGLDLRGALLLKYDGKPLGQVAYLSSEYGPVAFCIIRNGRDDAPPAFEERQGKNVVFWNRDGRGYLVIGAVPRESLETFAETLASRVS
ncbi:MAG: anti-sigma factor [Bauldia sp.]|nr:anti-sigma factor [Bauldia sp.]